MQTVVKRWRMLWCLNISYLQIATTKFSVSIINRLCSFFICFLVLLGVHLEYHLSFLCSDSMLLDKDLCPQFYKKKKQWRLGKAQLNITLFPFIFNEWYNSSLFLLMTNPMYISMQKHHAFTFHFEIFG